MNYSLLPIYFNKIYFYKIILFKLLKNKFKKTTLPFKPWISAPLKKVRTKNIAPFLFTFLIFKFNYSKKKLNLPIQYNFSYNLMKFELFFSNIILLGYQLLFFSTHLFKNLISYYNWFFLKKIIAFNLLPLFFNKVFFYKFISNDSFFFKKFFKKYLYFIIDITSNKLSLFFLFKFKMFTIAAPINFVYLKFITYPIFLSPLFKTVFYNFLFDLFLYFYILYLLKKSYKNRLILVVI